jgi:hypothetical protein
MKRHHTFLLAFGLTLLLGSGYLYFQHAYFSEAATPISPNSGLSTTATQTTSSAPSSSITGDIAFLNTLISLTTIKIDPSLLTNPAFTALHDNNVAIEPVTPGRTNPFAPISAGSSNQTTTAPVVTGDATQMTTTSVVLNGSVSSTIAPSALYFEYGPTQALGKTTATTVQSLVNTFIIKVSGLTSGTTYYYRADAKINGTVVSGDIVSFTTN